MAAIKVSIQNDNTVLISGLKKHSDSSLINDASITLALYDPDADSNVVSGVVLAYVAASSGDYSGSLSKDLVLVASKDYIAIIDADGGAGLAGHWEIPVTAEVRTS